MHIIAQKNRNKKRSKEDRCIESTDRVLREQSLLPLFFKVHHVAGDLPYRVLARCPFFGSPHSVLALKPDEELDIGWVEHPTWIRGIVLNVACRAKSNGVVCARKAKIYKVVFKENLEFEPSS